MSDHALRAAIRDRIAQLADGTDAIIVGYAAVVEVITPDSGGPWLKILTDDDSTPWAHVGRVAALRNVVDGNLDAGWEDDDE